VLYNIVAMRLIFVFIHYVWWHYTTAIADLTRNYLNLVHFLKNFFSLNHLTRNLFSPWRRLGEEYPPHFNPQAFLSALIINTLMRLVGFFVRFILVLIGLAVLVFSLFVFLLVLFVWLVMPLIIVFLLVFSYRLLMA
jgi:hypothetical protein